MDLPARLVIGALLAALVAAGGLVAGALTSSGALAALAVGTLTFGVGGPKWGVLLVTVFVSSSALSAWRREDKEPLATEIQAKGPRRDATQILANSGVAALLAAASQFAPPGAEAGLFAAYAGALAAVTADTWATELGLLSRIAPRMITTGEVVEPGTSGGVTVLGTSAAVLGGAFIGLCAAGLAALSDVAEFGSLDVHLLNVPLAARLMLVTPVSGLAGSAFDSYLGATVQAQYTCPRCGDVTERRVHGCGTPTEHSAGWRWMDNDTVNFLASLVGAAVGWGLVALL
ncbi:MAG: DUF92 domain-containing protein [Anaerolineae bacterium]